jgi:hypothetical protein
VSPSLEAIDAAIRAGAVAALRKRAQSQRERAADGATAPGAKFPGVVLRSPESAHALRIAADLEQIADDVERGAL